MPGQRVGCESQPLPDILRPSELVQLVKIEDPGVPAVFVLVLGKRSQDAEKDFVQEWARLRKAHRCTELLKRYRAQPQLPRKRSQYGIRTS